MAELLNIDCMEYMATLKDKAFELAIVDPPYGIGANGMTMGLNNGSILRSKQEWDENPPPDAYFAELRRVSKNYIVWGGNYFGQLWPCKCFLVWDKRQAKIPHRNMGDSELAATSFDQVCRTFRYLWDGFQKGTMDIGTQKIHPTMKPIQLYKWILTNYASPGDRILDTHLGSGSSAIAAHQMGFDFVGCEIDKDYYDASVKRFNNAIMQQSLFTPDQLK